MPDPRINDFIRRARELQTDWMDSGLEFEKDRGVYHYHIAELMMRAVIHVLEDKVKSFPIDQSYIQNKLDLAVQDLGLRVVKQPTKQQELV
jgi:hypothetical protein